MGGREILRGAESRGALVRSERETASAVGAFVVAETWLGSGRERREAVER
jgi:hypothetical protein